ncbi:MAG: 23S rRNA (adenine(2503)-C(2))-methyltransferase RlmN [Chitinophagaceae bacterium]|nr:23S rRNA (adenine(2503)-C(2))-methyltransferase RlmN [Chitinophagaceae bacterium]
MALTKNIRSLSKEELTEWVLSKGEKKYRAAQIWEWLWKKHARHFDEMTSISKELRDLMKGEFTFPALSIHTIQHSSDGTIKVAFKTADDNIMEGVLIPTDGRQTACVSSQVGCSLGCKFCATGFMGHMRNLTFDEIYDQAATLNEIALEHYGKKLSNIVYMGMGEPMLNYRNVLKSIEMVTSNDGLAMSPRRITVSTSGIAKMIKRLGDDEVRFHLALSLHAASDDKRSRIMPINDSNNIESLMDALEYFYEKTGNDITYEYILFKNLNDSIQDADNLIKLYRRVPVRLVNLIEYNPIDQADFEKPDREKTQKFMDYLAAHRVNVRLRLSRGKDIDAACGQLANKGLEKSEAGH